MFFCLGNLLLISLCPNVPKICLKLAYCLVVLTLFHSSCFAVLPFSVNFCCCFCEWSDDVFFGFFFQAMMIHRQVQRFFSLLYSSPIWVSSFACMCVWLCVSVWVWKFYVFIGNSLKIVELTVCYLRFSIKFSCSQYVGVVYNLQSYLANGIH